MKTNRTSNEWTSSESSRPNSRRPDASDPTSLLALGGLGRLLSTLARDFEFTKIAAGRTPGECTGLRHRRALASRVALAHYNVKSSNELRPHVPDEVVMYLGCDDLFPYLIEFRRTDVGAGQGGRAGT